MPTPSMLRTEQENVIKGQALYDAYAKDGRCGCDAKEFLVWMFSNGGRKVFQLALAHIRDELKKAGVHDT